MTDHPSTDKVSLARYAVLTADRRALRRELAPHERSDFSDAIVAGSRHDVSGEWSLADAARVALRAERLTGVAWYVLRMSARACRYERDQQPLNDLDRADAWQYGSIAHAAWIAAGRPDVPHGAVATFDDWGYRERHVTWRVIEFDDEPRIYDVGGYALALSDCVDTDEIALARAVRMGSGSLESGSGDSARSCALCSESRTSVHRPVPAVAAAWWHHALGDSECRWVPVCEGCFGSTHSMQPVTGCPACEQRAAVRDDVRIGDLVTVARTPGR